MAKRCSTRCHHLLQQQCRVRVSRRWISSHHHAHTVHSFLGEFTSFWKRFSTKFQETALWLSHLCWPINGKEGIHLAVQWHMTTFRKRLKNVERMQVVWSKKKRKVRTGTRNTFQNEVFSGDSRNQVFPMPIENRARKDQAYFLKRSSRINTRKKLPNYTEKWVEQHRKVGTFLF